MKRIGVVVPVYNTAEYLHQCIDSLLNQSYQELSIVLVDDGSHDESLAICNTYMLQDSRIQVIHQENKGKLAARYSGAQRADCDYLTFVDSDDWIAPNTYKEFVSQMELGTDVISWQIIRYYSPDFQKISGHLFPVGFYDAERFRSEVYPSMIWRFDKNTFGLDPSLCNKLIKREFILKSLESAQSLDISYGDDVAVVYPLLRDIHTLFLSKESMYYHRQRKPSETVPYFSDSEFYRKLYSLYEYLRSCFSKEPFFIEQLDTFYSTSVSLRLNSANNTYKQSGKYIFPFDKVPWGKNVILYGASKVGQDYYRQIRTIGYVHKLLWVDKNYHFYEHLGVKNIECLAEATEYDYVVIAIQDPTIASEVKACLSNILRGTHINIVWSAKELISI